QYRIVRMAKVFGVYRCGFYYWIDNRYKVTQRNEYRKQLDSKVRGVFNDKKERDSTRRIQKELEENGNKHGVKTTAARMKRQSLVAKPARKFKCKTDSKHRFPDVPNFLEQVFNAAAPNQKWVGGITYLATNEGWMYLAVVIDLYSRQVVGFTMNTRITAPLVCDALSVSLFRRGMPEGGLSIVIELSNFG
ncbi:DDE-type integrase/transposase/recombinase, partial [Vibrio coralliirubri]|uniref:DDE-type integrase/transposase/recombinase n=1 Tax=Vibrio coralliirubri TaxID=1516159 RepID=UPI001F0A32ED